MLLDTAIYAAVRRSLTVGAKRPADALTSWIRAGVSVVSVVCVGVNGCRSVTDLQVLGRTAEMRCSGQGCCDSQLQVIITNTYIRAD